MLDALPLMFARFRKKQQAPKLDASFEIPDDSGFLAIIDPDAYRGFVHSDWTLETIQKHFLKEMQERHLLIWHTGMEHMWRVGVSFEAGEVWAFREVVGSIAASQGRLLMTNYESLTMAAQSPDVGLPQRHEQEQVLSVAAGLYDCRIIQLSDPASEASFEEPTNFIYELTKSASSKAAWTEIPWGGGRVNSSP